MQNRVEASQPQDLGVVRNQSYKNRFSGRRLVRPALVISSALHALLLLIPLHTGQRSIQDQQQQAVQIKLTQLPRPTPNSKASPTPKPSTTPSPISRQSSPLPNRLLNVPQNLSPVVKPQGATTPTSVPTSVPTSPSATASVSPTPSPVAPNPNLNIPFADFPHLAGAQRGCFGQANCHKMDGVGFRKATQTLEQQMADQGYQVQARNDLEDSGQKIYELTTPDGTKRYLSVLSSDLGSSVYRLASEPLTLTDLQQVESTQQSLAALLDQMGSGTAITSQFPYPASFFTGVTPHPEIFKLRLASGIQPDQFVNTLTNQLQTSGFSFTPVGTYGGGAMYEVGQKAFTGYLSLLATQDGTGTILILWTTLPG